MFYNYFCPWNIGGLNARQLTDEDVRVLLDSFFNDSKKVEFGTVMTDV